MADIVVPFLLNYLPEVLERLTKDPKWLKNNSVGVKDEVNSTRMKLSKKNIISGGAEDEVNSTPLNPRLKNISGGVEDEVNSTRMKLSKKNILSGGAEDEVNLTPLNPRLKNISGGVEDEVNSTRMNPRLKTNSTGGAVNSSFMNFAILKPSLIFGVEDEVISTHLEAIKVEDEVNSAHLEVIKVEDEVNSTHLEDVINLILRELEQTNIFLIKSDKGDRSERLKELVRQIRDVAYEAEDVIDTFILEMAIVGTRHVLREMTHITHSPQVVAKKMKNLNNEINNIANYGGEWDEAATDVPYKRRKENEERRRENEKRRREDEEDNVVGFDDCSTKLVKQLLQGNPQLDVVSIIGSGGLGKTTLARKIYNNVVIKSHFNCRAWVSISQNFGTREFLLEILKSEMPKSDELTMKKLLKYLSEDELKKKLLRCLLGRRYLVVMDDIWRNEVWDEVRSAFPDNSNGSRILITSQVALHASLTPPYFLQVLNKDKSWELFTKKVFRGECHTELETLGRKIAEDCRGLPLSIVVLGGLLANIKQNHRAWSSLIDNVNWCLNEAETICKDILALTYTFLPLRLKPCFLYFGIYPEGFEIPVRQLMHMWVAEGFIQYNRQIDRRDPENVAEQYLEELMDRSLIQVASRRTDGGVKTCRIHALLRDFCISESAKEKFLEVSTDVNLLSANKSRRLSIQGSIDPYISSNPSHPSRSLLFLGQHTCGFDPNHWKWVLENFKLLRMLNFGCVDLYSIPTRIEDLFHLRYLGIESDALKAIPASIGKLINLETLDFRGTFLNCLPKEIWKLRSLKNLYMSGPVSLPLDPDLEMHSNLRVLSTVSLDLQTSSRIPLGRVSQLMKLGIWFASDENKSEVVDVLKSCLGKYHCLQTLKIINCLERPGLPISFPRPITKITLRLVRLNVRRDMRVLGQLSCLKILKLQSCLLSSKLRVFANRSKYHPLSRPPPSFPKLEVLQLENLRIKNWKQCRRAMPRLKHLVIKRCSDLTMLPSNRLSSTALQDVEVLWSSSKSAKMLQELQTKVGFKLLIYPPLPDNLHEKTAT